MSRIVRTKAEIAEEIEALKELRPRVKRYSMFGDDNHAKIDAEIETLEELRDEGEVYDVYESEHGVEPDAESPERDSALQAAQWLHGDNNDKPSDGWRSIAK